LGGVACMGLALVIFFVVPFIHAPKIKGPQFKPIFSFFFWLFATNVILLGWLGGQVVEQPYIIIGQISTFFYFFYLIVLLPVINIVETALVKTV